MIKDRVKPVDEKQSHHYLQDKGKRHKHWRGCLEKAYNKQNHKPRINVSNHSYRKQRVFFTHVMYTDIRIDEYVLPFHHECLLSLRPVSFPSVFESRSLNTF